MSDHIQSGSTPMAPRSTKSTQEDFTDAACAHILHGHAPEGHPGMKGAGGGSALPRRRQTLPFSQGDAGKGTNYSPHGDAGHHVGSKV